MTTQLHQSRESPFFFVRSAFQEGSNAHEVSMPLTERVGSRDCVNVPNISAKDFQSDAQLD